VSSPSHGAATVVATTPASQADTACAAGSEDEAASEATGTATAEAVTETTGVIAESSNDTAADAANVGEDEWEVSEDEWEVDFGYDDDAEAVDSIVEPFVPAKHDEDERHPMEEDTEEEEEAEEQDDEGTEDEDSADDDEDSAEEAEEAALLGLTPVDKVPVTGCHGENGTACPEGETCIVKHDGTWSQCFSCSKSTFGQECQKLDDYMRYAAVRTCKRTCLDQRCYNKRWCFKPYRCIVDKEEQWGQCISCHSKKFWKNSCFALKDGLRKKASRTCHRKCTR